MKRWIITALVILPPLLGLIALWKRSGESPSVVEPVDELLAYEIAPGHAVTLRLPGEIDDVLLTTWCIVEPQARYEPTTRYPYALKVSLLDRDGTVVKTRRLEPETRLSRTGSDTADYAAKLADSEEWVTDPRTLSVLTAAALTKGGLLRVELEPGTVHAVLLRPGYRQQRGVIERQAYERSLGLDARRRLDRGRTALGFADLAQDAREQALGAWSRRLDAEGREGTDFRVRRLLIGGLRTFSPVASGAQARFEIGPRHAIAINFDRPVSFDVVTPADKKLRFLNGEASSAPRVVAAESFTRVNDASARPHTMALEGEAGDDFHVSFQLPTEDARARIGGLPVTPRQEGLVEIGPDLRILRFFRLSPELPVVARIAPGQHVLRLLIRGEAGPGDLRESLEGVLTARWIDAAHIQRTQTLAVVLPHSKFDRWRGGGDSTDPQLALLRVLAGTERIEIVGDPWMRVSLFTEDPLIQADELQLPYRLPLAEDEVWRNAPYDIRKFAHVRPSNVEDLERAKLTADLVAQVRIEKLGAGAVRPEMLVIPAGDPVTRHFLEPTRRVANAPFPVDAWTRVPDSRTVIVDREGVRANRLTVTYLASEKRLGTPLRLLVDGAEASSTNLAVRSGTVEATASAGTHTIAVEGLGEGGVAFVNAAPASGAEIVRRRVVYEVTPMKEVTFRFPQPPARPLTLVVFVVTESPREPWVLRYTIDGGSPAKLTGEFFRALTTATGTIAGRGGDAGTGILWEGAQEAFAASAMPHGQGKAKIRVGDDLVPGMREVRVRLEGTLERAWVRAVLVGTESGPLPMDTRIWVAEQE